MKKILLLLFTIFLEAKIDAALQSRSASLYTSFVTKWIAQFNSKGNSALQEAIELGKEQDALIMLEGGFENSEIINFENHHGERPLHSAICAQKVRVVRKLLEEGAYVNVPYKNSTPLHMAAEIGNYEIAFLLLQYGASINIFDSNGKKPIDLAMQKKHFNVVLLLNGYKDIKERKRALEIDDKKAVARKRVMLVKKET